MRKPTLVQQSTDNHFNINYTGLFFLRIKAPRLNPQFLVFCKFGCTQSAAYRQINHTTRNPSKLDTEGRLVTVRTDGWTDGRRASNSSAATLLPRLSRPLSSLVSTLVHASIFVPLALKYLISPHFHSTGRHLNTKTLKTRLRHQTHTKGSPSSTLKIWAKMSAHFFY